MERGARDERLEAELDSLRALAKESDIFAFEAHGEPPERYTLIFRGRGVARARNAESEVQFVELHKIELRLPLAYPDQPPDLRWVTALFHPNLSFSGFIDLKDIGLSWEPDLGLDILCERLWDVARCAYLNLDHSTNYAAWSWFSGQQRLGLPVDLRPLRRTAGLSRTRGWDDRRWSVRPVRPLGAPNEVLFIGEETPIPEPWLALRQHPPDRDVLYIEEE
jgi:hypothetical protein